MTDKFEKCVEAAAEPLNELVKDAITRSPSDLGRTIRDAGNIVVNEFRTLFKQQEATLAELTALTNDALRVKLNEQLEAFVEKFRGIKLPGKITTVNELVLEALSMARDLRHIVDRATIAERDKTIGELKEALSFYAAIENYDSNGAPGNAVGVGPDQDKWELDEGQIAEAALAEQPEGEKG